MKYLIFLLLMPLNVFAEEPAAKKNEPRIAIQEIKDRSASGHADSCSFWGLWSTPGEAARELLINELAKLGGMTIVEREAISDLYHDEFEQENLDQSTVAERKKFIAANLAIAGSLSEFEWCLSDDSVGVNIGELLGVGGLGVKHRSSKAHVAVDLRLIDVKTGKILKTFNGKGQADDSGFEFSGDAFGIRLDKTAFARSPLGQATRSAVAEAAAQIAAEVKKLN